ncbi:unnamed protein product [Ilex paraguariensis]|uniref:Uncharacterized protein n=1 Tax=Ilex paraguariensis TaxID=185542 RepID=A0ABC8RXB7_9AQUA
MAKSRQRQGRDTYEENVMVMGNTVMITTFNISLIVHGTVAEDKDFQKEKRDPYAVPNGMGILKLLESPLDITTSTIIKRIVANHEAYQKRNERKAESEKRYYEDKTYVSGD